MKKMQRNKLILYADIVLLKLGIGPRMPSALTIGKYFQQTDWNCEKLILIITLDIWVPAILKLPFHTDPESGKTTF